MWALADKQSQGARSAQTFYLPINREDVQTKLLQNNALPLVLCRLTARGGGIREAAGAGREARKHDMHPPVFT